jgi:hypothetical protein
MSEEEAARAPFLAEIARLWCNLDMRKAVAALLLLAACATGGAGTRPRIAVSVVGARAASLLGPQMFLVQVLNESSEPLVIHRIRIDFASSGGAFEMIDNSETVDEQVIPGQVAQFNLSPNVIASRGDLTARPPSGRIDTVRVDIEGSTEAGGNFYDTGTYSVGVAR